MKSRSRRLIDVARSEELGQFRAPGPRSPAPAPSPRCSRSPRACRLDGSRAERNRELVERHHPSAVAIVGPEGTQVASRPDSPYTVEILAKPQTSRDVHPVKAREEDGMAYVDLDVGDLYEARATIPDREIAVSLMIDGLAAFHFTKDRNEHGEAKYTHFIVPSIDSMTILGWHNSPRGRPELPLVPGHQVRQGRREPGRGHQARARSA